MTARRDDCNIARVTHKDLEIWNQLPNDAWMLVENNTVVATVNLAKTTERRPDWSGKREYKNVIRHRAIIAVRIGYKREIVLDNRDGGYLFYGGEVKVLREILKAWANGWFWTEARWEAQRLSREAGATDLQSITADNDWPMRYTDQEITERIARNHLELVERLAA